MVGKGQRRREKNYRAAHGGDNRLPPAPKLRELEAIPAKLRRLIAIKNSISSPNSGAAPRKEEDAGSKKKAGKVSGEKEKKMNEKSLQSPVDGKSASIKQKEEDTVANSGGDGAKKGKRKRGKVMDLRFQELDQDVSNSRKKKRKEFLEAKKKKQKNAKTDSIPDFPGREQIRFGEVVKAPPKLSFPKVRSPLDVSRERLRQQAIENYRNRRGWTSRPGIQLPTLAENPIL